MTWCSRYGWGPRTKLSWVPLIKKIYPTLLRHFRPIRSAPRPSPARSFALRYFEMFFPRSLVENGRVDPKIRASQNKPPKNSTRMLWPRDQCPRIAYGTYRVSSTCLIVDTSHAIPGQCIGRDNWRQRFIISPRRRIRIFSTKYFLLVSLLDKVLLAK